MPELPQLIAYGPTVVLLVIFLLFVLKLSPTWERVKLREYDLQTHRLELDKAVEDKRLEIEERRMDVDREVACALSRLADTLKDVAVEQRRATETVEITQRVLADTSDQLRSSMNLLGARLDKVEQHVLEPERSDTRSN